MHVYCTHCGRQIPADDLNIETVIARCRACNAVFSFADAMAREEGTAKPARYERAPVPMPAGIREETAGGAQRFVRRWFEAYFVFLLVGSIACNELIIGLYYEEIAVGADASIKVVAFAVLLVAGVILAYYTVCGFANRTVIEVGNGKLSIRHRPLPWPGNRTLDAAEIDQLNCTRKTYHNKYDTTERFQLNALTKDGKTLRLLAGLPKPEQALYLEQEIEKALDIRNRPVRGEYSG